MNARQDVPLYYGWRIVAAAFVCNFVSTGFLFYSFSVFFKALGADLGGSRLAVSLGLALASAVSALASPAIGHALEPVAPRAGTDPSAREPLGAARVIAVGAVVTAAGFALLAAVRDLWQLYAAFGLLLGAGAAAMGAIAPVTLVSRWFSARRGFAMGIAAVGVSLSGLVMPPIATLLIARLGWRSAFLCYAAATLLLVLPLSAFVIVERPSDLGLHPDGAAAPATEPAARAWDAGELFRSRAFWCIAASFGLQFCAITAVLTHLVPHLTDGGMGPARAAWLMSLTAAGGVGGKLVFGVLSDRWSARASVSASMALQLVGLLLLMQPIGHTTIVAAVLFGVGFGGTVPLQNTTTASAFGAQAFARATGLMRPFMLPLHAGGAPLAGYLHDRYGSYAPAFTMFVAFYLLAALAIAALPDG
jgi:cyanate permease